MHWFTRLRWAAAAGILLGALLDRHWLHEYAHDGRVQAVGSAVAMYNLLLVLLMRRRRGGDLPALRLLAWGQIAADLACLTLLALWTGGAFSPLLGLFVLHMVFASLLLPRRFAYGGVALAALLVGSALTWTGQWPAQREGRGILLGWALVLPLTAYLTGHITAALRHHHRRTIRQGNRIRALARQIRRQHQAMIQQEKMAATGQMAAGVAHEIANPLACLDSLLLLARRKPERLRPEMIEKLQEQVQRIRHVVQDLTGFAHPADGQWQRVDLHEIVARTLKLVRFHQRARGLEIVRELLSEHAHVRAQPHALEQVLVNLVLNALDAMEHLPQPRLIIRCGRRGQECLVQVEDRGHGIAPELMQHLFTPFFTTKPVGKGTGLGLAISYSIARNHRGRIEVQSEPGQGAVFTLCLPAADLPQPGKPAP